MGSTSLCTVRTDDALKVRFRATVGDEPGVEVSGSSGYVLVCSCLAHRTIWARMLSIKRYPALVTCAWIHREIIVG